MATTDLWRVNGNGSGVGALPVAPPTGPSDREIVEALQRVASAQAHLSLAESRVREAHDPELAARMAARNRTIEAAHTETIWVQARRLGPERGARVEREVAAALANEREVLAEHGFSSFRDYLAARNEVPADETHLVLARRESQAAAAAWEQLQGAMAPTMIIDLTGDEPRIL
jgi:hypothetical protein